MQVIENDNLVMFDVDDTLIKWSDLYGQPHGKAIPIVDPNDNSTNYLTPHLKHISLVRKYKGRGMFVVVWSAAGFKWAEAVVKALNLEDCVSLICSKPTKFVDDLPAQEILGTRVFLSDYE